MNTRVAIAVVAVVAVVATSAVGVWALSGPDAVELRGSCADATWTVDLEPEDGGTEGSVEILTAQTDETWQVRATAGDQVVFDDERSAVAGEGEAELDLFAADADPEQVTITILAPSGEECVLTDRA